MIFPPTGSSSKTSLVWCNNKVVCKAIASAAFEDFIENDKQRSTDARANILALLSVLCRAQPDLLSLEQLKMLEVYTATLKTGADLRLYKPVAQIYRAAMPCFVANEHEFVNKLQTNMISSLQKIPSSELMDEVTACLWAMQQVLNNKSKLLATTQQVMQMLVNKREAEPRMVAKFIKMIGHFGKAWNLDDYVSKLQGTFTWWKGEHVADLIIQILLPSTEMKYAKEVRAGALESIGLTCQSWPKNYQNPKVFRALDAALKSEDVSLQRVVLCGLRDFFKICESQAKPLPQANGGATEGEQTEKLGTSMVSSESDLAGTSMVQQFFDDILRLSLQHTNDVALIATELICSASRQGLVHPRPCGVTLVALETSPVQGIAQLAYEEHLSLNAKHESILEKEYVRAIEQSFIYQRDTIKDNHGLALQPTLSPKLARFSEVLKSASVTTRKKLFPNLCKRLDITVAKLETMSKLEEHLLFAKFVCHNLAFITYSRVDEILSICATIEAIFSTTGNALSQRLEPLLATEPGSLSNTEELGQLTLCAQLLTLLWRTRCHLRSITNNMPSASGKQDKRNAKDTSKAPIRSPHAAKFEESYLKMTEGVGALTQEESMREQCRIFLDLYTVDHEAKVAGSSEEMQDDREGTPNDDASSVGTPSLPPSGSFQKARKRRRSESISAAGTPSGRKRGRPKLDGKRRSSTKKTDLDGGWD